MHVCVCMCVHVYVMFNFYKSTAGFNTFISLVWMSLSPCEEIKGYSILQYIKLIYSYSIRKTMNYFIVIV